MTVNDALIYRLEHLARLELSDEERQALKTDLGNMLDMVGKLQELDLSEVEPLVYLSETKDMLRADEVKGQVTVEAALKNAPDADGSYFLAPKVIDLK